MEDAFADALKRKRAKQAAEVAAVRSGQVSHADAFAQSAVAAAFRPVAVGSLRPA